MLKQCKATDSSKILDYRLPQDFIVMLKYDGHYVQIHKNGEDIKFYTSGGKEFYINNVAVELNKHFKDIDFIIECEYINSTEGKLGGRKQAAKLTRYRAQFSKGLTSNFTSTEKFMVFDIIKYKGDKFDIDLDTPFNHKVASHTFSRFEPLNIKFFDRAYVYHKEDIRDLEDLYVEFQKVIKRGWEGFIIKDYNHKYIPGKRVKTAVKLKHREQITLPCIRCTTGEGKYTNKIGALVLSYKQVTVQVGSGLTDEQRNKQPNEFIGKQVTISYESENVFTLVQPTIVEVHNE